MICLHVPALLVLLGKALLAVRHVTHKGLLLSMRALVILEGGASREGIAAGRTRMACGFSAICGYRSLVI